MRSRSSSSLAQQADSSVISDAESSFVPVSRIKSLNVQSSSNSFASTGDPGNKSELQQHSGTNDLKYRNAFGSDDATEAIVQPVSTAATERTAESRASSAISGFVVLDYGGGSLRSCKICTKLNPFEAVICDICGTALVANPNVDMDDQIALNVQNKEQKKIFTDGDEALARTIALMENGGWTDLDHQMARWYESNPEPESGAGYFSPPLFTNNNSNQRTPHNQKHDDKSDTDLNHDDLSEPDPEHVALEILLSENMKRKRKLYDCTSQSTYGTAQDLAQNSLMSSNPISTS